ncbi:MAG: hypothetical protein AB7D06_18655, partial [Pedobacter sp.]
NLGVISTRKMHFSLHYWLFEIRYFRVNFNLFQYIAIFSGPTKYVLFPVRMDEIKAFVCMDVNDRGDAGDRRGIDAKQKRRALLGQSRDDMQAAVILGAPTMT